MTLRTSPLVVRPRFEMLGICLKYLVPKLSEDDDAAEVEQEGGGVRTITYSDGSAKDMDDFNADELEGKLSVLLYNYNVERLVVARPSTHRKLPLALPFSPLFV